jgi:hypothetical protein
LSEFTSWSQLLKKSGFPRFRRKWQVYKPIIEFSTSNKTGKPESTVDNRPLRSLRIGQGSMSDIAILSQPIGSQTWGRIAPGQFPDSRTCLQLPQQPQYRDHSLCSVTEAYYDGS